MLEKLHIIRTYTCHISKTIRIPEQSQRKRGLAGAGAADDAELLPGRDAAGDAAQSRLARAVAQRQLLQLQRARLGPRRAGAVGEVPRRFLHAGQIL